MRVGETLHAVVVRDITYRSGPTGVEETIPAGEYYAAQPGAGAPGRARTVAYIFQSLSDPGGHYYVPADVVRPRVEAGDIRLSEEEF